MKPIMCIDEVNYDSINNFIFHVHIYSIFINQSVSTLSVSAVFLVANNVVSGDEKYVHQMTHYEKLPIDSLKSVSNFLTPSPLS